ncbi:hypothetical protein CKO25_03745 [Thiocapsa imhoffii]|uniref:Uncharacterized protein n=1 Tax=Thiocapsa imhoffii TaxID=382777 RepID=A0A9X0WFU1_9GAMM|nr:hypothetical protein [Thiocapsa imhoffii]MBK1643785.1 hypothetical protein [Thiocapsa imhoffii]
MIFEVTETSRRQAKAPHELAMINLIVFNLLIGVILLAASVAEPDSVIARVKWLAISIPLVASLGLIAFTWRQSRRPRHDGNWFAQTHWRLASRRYRLILIGYFLCAAILSLGFLGQDDQGELAEQLRSLPPAMQEMERRKLESQDMASAVWARIAVVPLLLVVMVTIMLESGSLYQAGRGELPDALLQRDPPPDGLLPCEQSDQSEQSS